MKLFITGASGFVGAEVLRIALEDGHDVVAPVRPASDAHRLAPFKGRYTHLGLDIGDKPALTSALAEHRPDAVVHLAWAGVNNAARFDEGQINLNIDTACNLVSAAGAAGCGAFIGVGSQGEYGAGNAMLEDSLPTPTTLYGAAKVATLFLTKQLAAQAGMRHAWLRLFSTYGPNDNDGWMIPSLITQMLRGERPQTTLGTQNWDWLHVTDVARGILAAAATPTAYGVFNLGSGQAIRVRDAIEMIRDLAAPQMELKFGEIPFRPDQVMHMEANIDKLRDATGWAPRITLREGMAATVAWYREHRQ